MSLKYRARVSNACWYGLSHITQGEYFNGQSNLAETDDASTWAGLQVHSNLTLPCDRPALQMHTRAPIPDHCIHVVTNKDSQHMYAVEDLLSRRSSGTAVKSMPLGQVESVLQLSLCPYE